VSHELRETFPTYVCLKLGTPSVCDLTAVAMADPNHGQVCKAVRWRVQVLSSATAHHSGHGGPWSFVLGYQRENCCVEAAHPIRVRGAGARYCATTDCREVVSHTQSVVRAATMVINRDYRWRIDVPTPQGDKQEVTKVGFRPVFEFRDGALTALGGGMSCNRHVERPFVVTGRGSNTYGEEVTRVRHSTDARVVGLSTTYAMTEDMIHLFRENRALTDKYVPRLRRERAIHRKLVRFCFLPLACHPRLFSR